MTPYNYKVKVKDDILFSFFFVARNKLELNTLQNFSDFMKLETIISKEKYFWFFIMRTKGINQTKLFYKNIYIDFDFKPIFFFVWNFKTTEVHRFVYLSSLDIFLNPLNKGVHGPMSAFVDFMNNKYVKMLKIKEHSLKKK